MKVQVNGELQNLLHLTSLIGFLEMLGLQERMVVIELNGEIVPRPQYAETVLSEGDEIEIVQMMAGG